jgi:hypothetical protein
VTHSGKETGLGGIGLFGQFLGGHDFLSGDFQIANINTVLQVNESTVTPFDKPACVFVKPAGKGIKIFPYDNFVPALFQFFKRAERTNPILVFPQYLPAGLSNYPVIQTEASPHGFVDKENPAVFRVRNKEKGFNTVENVPKNIGGYAGLGHFIQHIVDRGAQRLYFQKSPAVCGKPPGGCYFMNIPGKALNGTEYQTVYHDVMNENDQGKDEYKTQNKPVKPNKDAAVRFREAGDFRQQKTEHGDCQSYNGE